MLTDSEKRAILMAVSRFATDQNRAQKAVHAALASLGEGDVSALLSTLVRQNFLTDHQAHDLRKSINTEKESLESPTLLALKDQEKTVTEEEPELKQFGEFRILRKLGQGGMCPVYLAYQERQNLKVAIKILPEQIATKQSLLDRFYREAKSGALLNHPNIVRNFTFGQDKATGRHYLVMEYVDGPSALNLLEKFHHLSLGDALHIILDIARGLEYAHSRNFIHRDIKPDNILLTQTGVAKLADLGLAKRTDETSHLTAARQGFGTPHYMPYEQAVNARYVDGRGDIYALGATLYHLLTGEIPFPGDSHLEIVEKKAIGWFAPAGSLNLEVPPVLDEILDLTLAREPKDRYQTVSELIVDLERTNLAAPVLSFVDKDRAISDPIVRERLAVNGQPTSLDLHLKGQNPQEEQKSNPDIWYLRFPIRNKQWCKTRATTAQVIKRLREKKIPKGVQASHDADGEYRPLNNFAEFQAALRQSTRKVRKASANAKLPEPIPSAPRSWKQRILDELSTRWVLYLSGGLAAAILLVVGLVVFTVLLRS